MAEQIVVEPDPVEEAYWSSLRHELMLDPTVTYLNNGSYGSCAKVVFDVVVEHMKRHQSQPCHQLLFESPSIVRASKEKLGAYVGADPDHFAMVMNLTVGMNMVANGLDLEAGTEILSTDQEYGAVNNCWASAAEQNGWVINRVSIPSPPESHDQIVEIVANGITPQTKVLVFSHITTSTGLIMPVKRLVELAREQGILSVVDGAHVPGMIPLNIEDTGADIYVGNCHKWLMGPMGTAFLYVRPEIQEQIRPSVVGWGMSFDKLLSAGLRSIMPSMSMTYMYRFFEFLGTRDVAPFIGVGTAVDFQRGIGIDRIAARGRQLARYLRTALKERIPEAGLLTPQDERLSGSITAFTIPPIGDRHVMIELWQRHRIQIGGLRTEPEVARCRISTHYYNSYTDIDRFLEALIELRAEYQ